MKIRHTFSLSLVISNALLAVAIHAMAANYYLNSRAGNDNNKGTSKEKPWRSLKNLSIKKFLPGDHILFAKGSEFTGGFIFACSGMKDNPITFSAYGKGTPPAFSNPDWKVLHGNIFRILGSYIIIERLYFHDNTRPPGSNKYNRNVQKMGAVYLAIGADHNIIRNCEFYHSPVGIKVKGNYDSVLHNYLHDADSMARTWGAIGIMVVSAHNEIAYNKITNYGYYGGAYGSDGGAIELDGVDSSFDGRDIKINHNISIGNHGFLEMAGRNIDSVVIAYNLSDDVDKFVGVGSMKHVWILNNTVIRTREPNIDRYIFWSFDPSHTHCIIRNNIFILPKDIQVYAPFKKPKGHHRTGIGNQPHDHNLYFAYGNPDPLGIAPGVGDIIANPLFVDAKRDDFRLKKNSPAIGKGIPVGYKWDINHRRIHGRPDMGAYEHG